MNENLNLCEILKDCPKGTKLWSPVWGNVTLVGINGENPFPIDLEKKVGLSYASLRSNGKMYDAKEAECLLFPSKDQRDWSKFERFWKKSKKINKFDPKSLNPFDKILVRKIYGPHNISPWFCEFFSYKHPNTPTLVNGISNRYEICIPYNEETKHLVGTTEDCPEYYKWWEKQL